MFALLESAVKYRNITITTKLYKAIYQNLNADARFLSANNSNAQDMDEPGTEMTDCPCFTKEDVFEYGQEFHRGYL